MHPNITLYSITHLFDASSYNIELNLIELFNNAGRKVSG